MTIVMTTHLHNTHLNEKKNGILAMFGVLCINV